MPSLCTGAGFISLGNREENRRNEGSQETCLYVGAQICGPQILFLINVFDLPVLSKDLKSFIGAAA